MTNEQKHEAAKLLKAICDAVVEAVAAGGKLGVSGGTLYAALMVQGCTLPDVLAACSVPKVAHTYYAEPSIRVTEHSTTSKIEVRGLLAIAPDAHTVIEYPIIVWSSGYWSRATTRAALSQVKKRLLAECAALGYTKNNFSKPLAVHLFWE